MSGRQEAFEEMAAASYESFKEKFEAKKTTDDCYTPQNIYDAVADFVAKNYGLEKRHFRRVFWPGGDYQAEEYAPEDVVVDNPPFSILSQILKFYSDHGVRYFLFAPALTLFSPSSSFCAIPCGVGITYENGANVATSFVTNLEDWRVKTYPELYRAIAAADDANRAMKTKTLPKYEYPDEIITAAMVQRWAKYGISYSLRREDSEKIGTLDAQRKVGKSIFGYGYIISERAAAERAAAERAVAERAAAERWELSARERNIVARLSGKPETHTDDPEIKGQICITEVLYESLERTANS